MNSETRPGYYQAAGMWYSENDLFGYPDSLIRARLSSAYRFAARQLQQYNPKQIIDIGSCHGHGVDEISQTLQPEFVYSTDRWQDFLAIQQRVLPQHKSDTKVGFATLRAPDLPFVANTFDAVFLMHVIEHMPDTTTLLNEIKRILTPQGKLILATPNALNIVGKNPTDKQLYTWETLTKLLKINGFTTELYSIVADDKAWTVHERKKRLAQNYPWTGELRKHVPWQWWDKHILHSELTVNNFQVLPERDIHSIDLLAFAQKS